MHVSSFKLHRYKHRFVVNKILDRKKTVFSRYSGAFLQIEKHGLKHIHELSISQFNIPLSFTDI